MSFNHDEGPEDMEDMEDVDLPWIVKPAEVQPLVTRITKQARHAVLALEDATIAFSRLDKDASARNTDLAYGYLQSCRKDLYTHIAELERAAGIKYRTVNLRF